MYLFYGSAKLIKYISLRNQIIFGFGSMFDIFSMPMSVVTEIEGILA